MPETNETSSRYGIYFCPSANSPLLRLGSSWLGRDAATGESRNPELPDSIRHDKWMRATDSPRRYGFHATLKPPFRLASHATYQDLRAALHAFAQSRSSFYAPPLAVNTLGRFLALTLTEACSDFVDLAADCVREFELFRAPTTELETAQRLRSSLSLREREHVLQWGYPYVLDTWKFHMSLTSSMHTESILVFEPYLRDQFASACKQPLLVDSVCIFHEPYPGANFRILDRASLRSA